MAHPDEIADDQLAQLLASARRGDDDALARIAERYGPDLLRVVRRKLPARLRTVFDSQDFVQATWATVLRHEIDTNRFDSPRELLAYLSGVASHKVTEQIKKRLVAQKASLNREVPLAAYGGDVASRRPGTPSQFAIANEWVDRLLKDQPPHYRRIIELKAAGASAAEIAAAVEMNVGSVRRILRILEKASERAAET